MKAIFIDKDGTLIRDVPYNVDPELIELDPDAGEALRQWQRAGFRIIVISNQSGVAQGYFAESALTAVQLRLNALLEPFGVALDGFYYCPHHPHGSVPEYTLACSCRKPEPGLILRAAADHGIDLAASWMIGDILNDVEAGNKAGCRTILLNNGNETEWVTGPFRTPTFTVNRLSEVTPLLTGKPVPVAVL